jgi:hypothetical protein
MKETVFFGLLAIVLAFGFIGCDSESNGDLAVTFNLDGGNINGNTASVVIPVKSGGTIDNLPNPQRVDYTFGNWFTGTNGSGNQFTSTTIVNSNMTVFAKWTPVENGHPDPITGLQVYTFNGTFSEFSGTGSELEVTGLVTDGPSHGSSLGKIGKISGDGKLSLELPNTIADDKLFLIPTEFGGDGTTKFCMVNFIVSGGTYNKLYLYNSSNTNRDVIFQYFDRDISVNGLTAKKGWNYIEHENFTNQQIITNISTHRWVIIQE